MWEKSKHIHHLVQSEASGWGSPSLTLTVLLHTLTPQTNDVWRTRHFNVLTLRPTASRWMRRTVQFLPHNLSHCLLSSDFLRNPTSIERLQILIPGGPLPSPLPWENQPLKSHLSMTDIWVASTSRLLWMMLLCTWVYYWKHSYFWYYRSVNAGSCGISNFDFPRPCHIAFHRGYPTLHPHEHCTAAPVPAYLHLRLLFLFLFLFLTVAILMRVTWYVIVVSICDSPND